MCACLTRSSSRAVTCRDPQITQGPGTRTQAGARHSNEGVKPWQQGQQGPKDLTHAPEPWHPTAAGHSTTPAERLERPWRVPFPGSRCPRTTCHSCSRGHERPTQRTQGTGGGGGKLACFSKANGAKGKPQDTRVTGSSKGRMRWCVRGRAELPHPPPSPTPWVLPGRELGRGRVPSTIVVIHKQDLGWCVVQRELGLRGAVMQTSGKLAL
jgi:hypothetical protein